MGVDLPTAILFDAATQLELGDENPILERLAARDEALLAAILVLQKTREDLFAQFGRVAGVESQLESINRQIDAIISAFLLDIDGDGNPLNNFEFFVELIKDLEQALVDLDRLSAQIIRFDDIKALLIPIAEKIEQIEDTDRLIVTKLDHIYGKWNINPLDDIFAA